MMTHKQASQLHFGDRVRFESDGMLGTVLDTWHNEHYPSLGSVHIKWDDGTEGDVDFQDFQHITFVTEPASSVLDRPDVKILFS